MRIKFDVVDETAKLKLGSGDNVDAMFKKALLRTALFGKLMIQDRMDKGISYKGGIFKKYSEKYRKFRLAAGRGQKPDLQFTRQMRSGMVVNATSNKAKIFFSRPDDAKKAFKNEKTRPFFGFSNTELDKLRDKLIENLK
jgi:hypothetical protein